MSKKRNYVIEILQNNHFESVCVCHLYKVACDIYEFYFNKGFICRICLIERGCIICEKEI